MNCLNFSYFNHLILQILNLSSIINLSYHPTQTLSIRNRASKEDWENNCNSIRKGLNSRHSMWKTHPSDADCKKTVSSKTSTLPEILARADSIDKFMKPYSISDNNFSIIQLAYGLGHFMTVFTNPKVLHYSNSCRRFCPQQAICNSQPLTMLPQSI